MKSDQGTLTFQAVDVETANADRASICQIGVVAVKDGNIEEEWETLVNPEDWFDPFNVSIHGINAAKTKKSPTLPELRAQLDQLLSDAVVFSHTSFDRVALERAFAKYQLPAFQSTWADSARLVRRAWPDRYGQRGWGLLPVARDLNIEFDHHDALADARAAALIVLAVCQQLEVDVGQCLEMEQRRPASRIRTQASIGREGNESGDLFGETVVFTGSLSVSRPVAADLAALAGCRVAAGVSRKVTLLVVGLQDERRLRGYGKSRKHRRAEELNAAGASIQILSEADFLALVQEAPP